MMIEPITPDDIGAAKANIFPDFVIESVNALIAANYTNGRANFTQKDVISEMMQRANGDIKRTEIFENGYLNFEEIYRDRGWKVEYDKPAYYETYDANFTFTRK